TLDLLAGTFTQTGTVSGLASGLLGDLARLPGGPLYGMDSSSNLVTIDPITAEAVIVGPSGNGIFALGFRQNGDLFGASANNLYTINPATGAAVLVGSMGSFLQRGFWDIQFDNNDTLFLVEDQRSGASSLYTA